MRVVSSGVRASRKASSFTESVIREMTRLADLHGAINLGQGFPDFPAPTRSEGRRASRDRRGSQPVPVTWGVPAFRDAIAAKYRRDYGMDGRPRDRDLRHVRLHGGDDRHVPRRARPRRRGRPLRAVLRELRPGLRILAGATRRCVTLRPPDWTFDEAELRAAFSDRTTGDRGELAAQPDRQGVRA